MDIRSNEPYWLIKNALTNSYSSLKEDMSAEVLIVGGGITGALIAYKLIKEGKKVVLIDRRDVCNGSSAASTAMLQYEIDAPLHELIEQRGLTCAVASYQNCEKAIFDLKKIVGEIKSDCQFEFKKSVYFSSTKKDVDFLEKEFEARKQHGFKVKWLDKEKLQKLGLIAEAGIESESAAVMDTYKFAGDLLEYCSEKGLTIFDRTELESVKEENESLSAITKSGFKIEVQHLVYCTGYESVETLKEDIVDLKSTYALASEAFRKIPKAFKDHIYWNTSEPYLYFRGTKDGRIIMGGGDENFKNAKKRDALLPKKEKNLTKAFNKCFPDISFELDYSWAGTFGETKDGLPYLGKPDLDKNKHYVLGFGGNGIMFSVMGMDAILNSLHKTPHPYLEYYKFGR
ncbi:glycine/D-amino acid oxidase-like deaminating enzyme [Gillisia sp. Hel_I_86]|uniref:NAD(P)/FAD-dependent oxidoreductase n=1 Tax=Gillisia sp. Hel_I_86 TaxID=1249981 RepID=UPI00119C27D1|nr:FAD-dependent oxidoreductase [Gillisia sp. Hel_I_86]TVZ26673.1 glycine/D-amino acid oxidase-like deaminating enzyme [Gillisia sp. Hel_I_86]